MASDAEFEAADAMIFRIHSEWRQRNAFDAKRDWVPPSSSRTVPARVLDLPSEIPGLKKLGRTAVLLHPRYSDEPAVTESKLGGPFHWPEDKPWPTCEEHQVAYVPALQLTKDEFPEIEFRPGCDLLQLLWCPRDHGWVKLSVVFQDSKTIGKTLSTMPLAQPALPGFVPRPCRLFPERIVEYPRFEDLVPDVASQMPATVSQEVIAKRHATEAWDPPPIFKDQYNVYEYAFHPCYEGWKISGWPRWIQRPEWPLCKHCKSRMEFLLQIGGETVGMGFPVEEQSICAKMFSKDPGAADASKAWENASNAPGLLFGKDGALYVFVCRKCEGPGWPIKYFGQV